MQTDEPETLLWNDRPSRNIEDEIARTIVAPARTHSIDLAPQPAVSGFPVLQLQPGRGQLITVAAEIFRGFLELMANGTMNRDTTAAVRESVRLARLLIAETDERPKAKTENR